MLFMTRIVKKCVCKSVLRLFQSRSQWPRGLMRGSAAAHLLRFGSHLGHGCLSVVCSQVEDSVTS